MQKELTPQIAAMYLGCDVNTAYGVGQMLSLSAQSFCTTNMPGGPAVTFSLNQIELVLRPLSDITEEESTHLAKMLYCEEGEEPNERLIHNAKLAITDNFGTPHMASWRLGFETMLYLLSKHFDLFGLIKSGLAIEKK